MGVRIAGLLLVLAVLRASGAAAADAEASGGVCPDIAAANKAFLLNVSNGNILLPNGKQMKEGLLYNNSYIGPLIKAALGEEISVDVANGADVGTSVHWHGMDLANGAWADGVDGVTQQPIPPGQSFRYKFKAEPAGTLWYHSHVGMQFADGLRGPLIVTDPKDPYKGAYDEEVVLLVSDQNNESGQKELAALQDGTATMAMGMCTNVSSQDWSDAPFTTILTNGKGFMPDPATKKPVGSPHIIKVEKGKRYRFRMIQGAASWGLKVKVQGHGITVIALDGSNVQATPAKGFVFTPGERVDFILHANQPVGNYWISIATLTGNNSPALLSYVGADASAAGPPQLSLGCDWAMDEPGVLDFKNRTMQPHTSVPAPPQQPTMTLAVYLSNNAAPEQSKQSVLGNKAIMGMQKAAVTPQNGCNKLPDGRPSSYCWTLNWVQFEGAKNGVPLLFPEAQPGNNTYIQEVPFGAVVDVVVINPGTMLHPMHLHGQRFWVLGAGNGNILTPEGKVDYSKLNTKSPIMRDTQPVANAIPGTATSTPQMKAMSSGRRLKQMSGMADMPGMTGPQQPSASPPKAGDGMPGMQQPAAATPLPAASAPKAKEAMPGMQQLAPATTVMSPTAASSTQPAMAAGGMSSGGSMGGMGVKAAPAAPMDSMAGMPAAGSQQTMAKPAAPAKQPAMTDMPGMVPASAAATTAGQLGSMAGMAVGNTMPVSSAQASEASTPGYTVIRFKANNPGIWAFHCHIDLHANSGMMMAFKVAAPAGAQHSSEPWSLPKGITACGAAGSKTRSLKGMDSSPAPTPAAATTQPAPATSAAARLPAISMLMYMGTFVVVALLGRMA